MSSVPHARYLLPFLVALSGCGEPDPNDCSSEAPEATDPVWLTTRDGVCLEADFRSPEGTAGVVLLHMNPSASNDRDNWPAEFVDRLSGQGWGVLVPDRRGAGVSGGVAEDAYQGEAGRYDVEANIRYLEDHGVTEVAIVAASNGTTSMVDYVAWAPSEGLSQPVSISFLTGGTYTENQTTVAELPPISALFTYGSEEDDWSEEQIPSNPGTWAFEEYEGGGHGIHLFDTHPEVADELMDFVGVSFTTSP